MEEETYQHNVDGPDKGFNWTDTCRETVMRWLENSGTCHSPEGGYSLSEHEKR